LIQNVHNLCDNRDFAGKTVILLMKSGPAHMSERVLRSLGEHHIVVALLTLYISILSAADLVFFHAMKEFGTTLPREFVEGLMSELTRQLTQDFVQVVASMTMPCSF
jgi:hypothetical protein